MIRTALLAIVMACLGGCVMPTPMPQGSGLLGSELQAPTPTEVRLPCTDEAQDDSHRYERCVEESRPRTEVTCETQCNFGACRTVCR